MCNVSICVLDQAWPFLLIGGRSVLFKLVLWHSSFRFLLHCQTAVKQGNHLHLVHE